MKISSGINIRYSLKDKTLFVVPFHERLFKDKMLYSSFIDALSLEIRTTINDFKEIDENLHVSEKNCRAISRKAANNFLIDWISGGEDV